ncbi:hypothetical protein EDD16DRAFT_1689324 [Pisolithus croceorrhizus]|nr:hypothetical protein EDD16DRAFT_1689324 [Pisolithus croceorrhizus]KAI6160095.1 hypothetical protein EDD17DRAFT_1761638 [Pisolithus thermaeus]
MFRKSKDHPDPPPKPSSPPGFYRQLASGSRFAEDEVSAFWISDTGSEVTARGSLYPSRTKPRAATKSQKSPKKAPPSLHDSPEIETSSIRTLSPYHHQTSVSFVTSAYDADSFTEDDRLNIKSNENPCLFLLSKVAPEESRNCLLLLQTSLSQDRNVIRDTIPQKNGFVKTVMEAFNNHRCLIIRPDDVWLAILLQFNAFVNAGRTADDSFMVNLGDNLHSVDPSIIADQMMSLMRDRISSWEFQEWIASSFTTSTNVDTTACVVSSLGTTEWDWKEHSLALQDMHLCGSARVTLEGTKRDWENILTRLEKLKDYGIPAIAWYHHLFPVITRFVAAYDNPNSPENVEFWSRAIIYDNTAGYPLIAGWITAFCLFGEHGRWQGNPLNEERARDHEPRKLLRPANPRHLTPSQFACVYMYRDRHPHLMLDGFPYPTIDVRAIPCGRAHLEVKMADKDGHVNGELVAGSIGSQICSTEKSELFRNGLRDTVRPVTAWWLFKTYSRRQRGYPMT